MASIDEILISVSPGETRMALVAGGRVVEFQFDRGEAAPGALIQGRVVSVNRQLEAAFIELGEALPGFLKRAQGLTEGQEVVVEVVAAARGGKGAVVKPRPDLPAGQGLPPAPHPLARLLERYPTVERVLVDAPAMLGELRAIFPDTELYRDGPLFAVHDAEDALEAALAPRVALEGGGTLIIEAAAGLTVIDVDSGRGTPLDANLAAVPEIARQLRLRGIGGHVMVDMIPLRDRRARQLMADALKAEVAGDPTPTKVVGVTPLGMVEITRDRKGPSLADILLEPVPHRRNAQTLGLDALRALLAEARARPGALLGLSLPPAAAAALRRRPQALDEAARRLGHPVALEDHHGQQDFAVIEVKR